MRCPIHCPKCNRIVMDSTQDGGFKLRTRMVLFSSEGYAHALCPSCKEPVHVPVFLGRAIASERPFIYVETK